MYRRIVATTDFSRSSERAIEVAVELSRKLGASLVVLHVNEGAPAVATHFLSDTHLKDAAALASQAAKSDLDRITAEHLKELPGARAVLVEDVSPIEGILEYAEKNEVDLLVIATHGRTGLARLLIGSVAERVVRHAPCAVLTVRAGPKPD